jgi:predicted amidohydrolase
VTVKADVVRAAVVQASPVFLDRDASLQKAVRLIAEAAGKGATLAAFGEGWLPGYPFHAWSSAKSELWWELAAAYLDQAVDFRGATIDALCSAAREANIDVVIGVAELDPTTHGSVYSTLLFIGGDGQVLGRHRKLRPAAYERVVWADGDVIGLRAHDCGYANLTGLLSTEHQMVLPTYALAEQGTQIHVASWPGGELPRSPLSMWSRQQLLSRAFAVQTGAYVLCAAGTLARDAVPEKYRDYLMQDFTGDSVIIDPRGEIIAGPVQGEDTVIAECSMALVRSAKVAFDCAGHSARRDQLKLDIEPPEEYDSPEASNAEARSDGASQPADEKQGV